MNLVRRTLIAAATLAALSTPLASLAQDIKPRLIRFGYGLNEQSNQGRAVKLFAEQVEKASGGKMKIRAIGAAALGPDTQMQQALIGGMAAGGLIVSIRGVRMTMGASSTMKSAYVNMRFRIERCLLT